MIPYERNNPQLVRLRVRVDWLMMLLWPFVITREQRITLTLSSRETDEFAYDSSLSSCSLGVHCDTHFTVLVADHARELEVIRPRVHLSQFYSTSVQYQHNHNQSTTNAAKLAIQDEISHIAHLFFSFARLCCDMLLWICHSAHDGGGIHHHKHPKRQQQQH